MDAIKAIKAAMDELEKIKFERAKCNGWRNLTELFRALGAFAEDGVDEVLSYLEEARVAAQELIEENESLKERLAMDVQEEEGERCASYDCI